MQAICRILRPQSWQREQLMMETKPQALRTQCLQIVIAKPVAACAGVLLLVGDRVDGLGPHRSLYCHHHACLGGMLSSLCLHTRLNLAMSVSGSPLGLFPWHQTAPVLIGKSGSCLHSCG